MLKQEPKIFANLVRDPILNRPVILASHSDRLGLGTVKLAQQWSMNPWFSRSSSQKLRSNSQKGEWNGFKEHFENRPLMPLTSSGVTPFLETPFKKLAVSTARICSIF